MIATLDCTGSEENLLDCSRNVYSILHCFSYEVAGVICEGIKCESSYQLLFNVYCITELCTDGEVRIMGNLSPKIGRVEACVNRTWGTICDSTWNEAAASVICKHQGFSPYGM